MRRLYSPHCVFRNLAVQENYHSLLTPSVWCVKGEEQTHQQCTSHSKVRGWARTLLGKSSALDLDSAFNWFNICVVRSHLSLSCLVMSFYLAAQEKLQRSTVPDMGVGSPPKQQGASDTPRHAPRFDKVDRTAWPPSIRNCAWNTPPCPPADSISEPRELPTHTRGNSDLQIPAVKLFLPFGSADDSLVFLSPSLRAQFAETQHRKITILRRCNYTAAVSMGKCGRLDSGAHIRNS